ncbi:rust resistance kinase Lr10-like [Neltuma alba]|uniref:rust resistance kinase Lr10-like n=1 Tax=Neltuma alba TaxID=207710 RepID=UPI0010A2EB07|nr:rust resistance kinase Lr10-like [Prosopis alba]
MKILSDSEIGNGEDFIREVGTMAKIHHVNIIRLVGFCADGFRRALVYEYLPNDSLQNFINSLGQRKNFPGWKKLQEIGLGIAKGIEYLHHGCEKRMLHFDIKPQNVLLDSDFTPKISDFGLAKLCSKNQSIVSITNARGTFGHIAPKVFSQNFGNVSHKANVYSFGMLLLEVIAGRMITNDAEENAAHI